MRDVKEIAGLTYEDIAAASDGMLSTGTVQNVLAPKAKGDVTRETARLIENAIFGSSNTHPCPIDILGEIPDEKKKIMDTEIEMAKLRENINLIHNSYKEELEIVRAEAKKKVDFLLKEIERQNSIIDKLMARM